MKNFINNFKLLPQTFCMLSAIVALSSIIICVKNLLPVAITTPPEKITANTPKITYLPDIADFHIFGSFNSNINELPQTLLQLSLQGTIIFNNATASALALISSQNGTTKIYKVGDTVPGGATIKEIKHNLVVLDDNQQLEVLKLPIPKLAQDVYTAASQ